MKSSTFREDITRAALAYRARLHAPAVREVVAEALGHAHARALPYELSEETVEIRGMPVRKAA